MKVYDCGCIVRQINKTPLWATWALQVGYEIEYCPTHAAAFDLLTLCQQAHRMLVSNIEDGPIPSDSTVLSVMVERLGDSIAQVEEATCS